MSENEEDHYEAIELIVKSRSRVDGETWFDLIHDFITADCKGSETEPCTCGMESMGAFGGTLDECYDWSTSVGRGLQPIDLARAIVHLTDHTFNSLGTDDEQIAAQGVIKAIEWARKELEFEDWFDNRGWEQEEGWDDSDDV